MRLVVGIISLPNNDRITNTTNLSGRAGAYSLADGSDNDRLLTESITLKKLLNGTSMDVPSFLHIAVALTEWVYTAHKHDSLIGNLNPKSVHINVMKNVTFLHGNQLTDYAYLSPEQTGRINRMPDKRSDMYALGIIFYEMLAGSLPFQAQNMEEWRHAHLAIMPIALSEQRSETEGSLEDIIMKLLSKGPEERYQSAYGLLNDLKRCISLIKEKGAIIPFEIACADEASRFQLPQTIFGREAEEKALREAYEQSSSGISKFVFVSGNAGSGKTALVREFQELVRREGGLFIRGKCDLMNQETPFSPLLQALRSLIQQIWSKSREKVEKLKLGLTEALGHGAAVIVQLLPEATKLFGEFPSAELLPPAEAAIRFRRLFPIFMNLFADKEHPLVIFLDDLQWADPATMDVLRAVVHDRAKPGLLVIGAFREKSAWIGIDNEESQRAANAWIEESFKVNQVGSSLSLKHIVLEPLTYFEVRQFVSHTLNENSARIRSLAELLYHRTGGNPLYVHRLLDILYRENKLYFDEENGKWAWDVDVVSGIPEDPDVLELIGTRIRMLSSEAIELLAIGAAIGHRFLASTIALVSGQSYQYTFQLLCFVEDEGLLCRESATGEAETEDVYFTFLHDRVQQAAYMTIPETEKETVHLTIGRVLKVHQDDENEHSIFEMVYHLNLGSGQMKDEAEKRELAEYNFMAGMKSKATTAFAAALNYFEIGLRLAEDDGEQSKSLAYRLMLELPECEYMCGHIEKAEELLERLMNCTTDLVERSHIYLKRIAMNTYLKNDEIAVQIGSKALAEFGWHLPRKPSKATVVKEVLMTQSALLSMRNNILNLRINREPHYKALSDLIMAISTSVFTISLELSAVLFAKFVRYGLRHGNNEAFTFIFASYGMIVYKVSFYQTGPQYVDQAFELSSSFESADLLCRLHYLRGLTRLQENPQDVVKHYEKSIHYGMESANLSYVSIAMLTATTTHIGDLQSLSARIKEYEEISQQLVDEVTLNIFRIARWYVAQLEGGAGESDEVVIPYLNDRFEETLNNEVYYTCTCQIEIAYLFGRYREALEWIERGKFNTFRQTRMQGRKQHIYHALTLAAMYEEQSQKERHNIRGELKKQLRTMKHWSGYYGRGSSAFLLIKAELHRVVGERVTAAKGYDDAIRAARSEGNDLIEAISCERSSIFYRESGSTTGADVLIEDACTAYSLWGASAKVRRLREANTETSIFSVLLQENSVAVTKEVSQLKTLQESMPLYVDDKMLLRQITEWSSTEDSSNVMKLFLESALRYSGAEKGYMLNSDEVGFTIADQTGSIIQRVEEISYAIAIVRYVVETGESLVLADASHSTYAADPYVLRSGTQSVLCMPVLFPSVPTRSVLYLENNLISGAFTKERLEVLELMIARMVYLKSLEDSRLQIGVSKESRDSLSDIATKTLEPLIEPLTNRESEILFALTDGLSNKEIAYRFGLTEGTVKSYVFHLYGKLGVKRRSQAIARAKELGLVD
ncbi:DUF2791 family P-loop domain-containing protein [Paenibacillus sp. GSMTC-2017]|uniref:BREX system ATP-binding domain-containing protein n=1 Tax=Paenibacillus sp. GSMTC-2017 TaxID=2794350 RepID=UPI0018D9B285|nr:BREX system ATP-binding domain-containing protein [Paenibacillus sp. GSMTC-2017]MBH5317523.1 DUF2791 family P-loop domain-containing protein [Paenibacillus sp. GSMTC-2017]